jgi:hypothetical protein
VPTEIVLIYEERRGEGLRVLVIPREVVRDIDDGYCYLKRFLLMSSALILDSKVVDGRPSFRAAPVEPDTLPLDSVNAPRNLLKLVLVFG